MELPQSPGVYAWLFTSGDYHLGKTNNLRRYHRDQHRRVARGQLGKKLAAAWADNGMIEFKVLSQCDSGNLEAERERHARLFELAATGSELGNKWGVPK